MLQAMDKKNKYVTQAIIALVVLVGIFVINPFLIINTGEVGIKVSKITGNISSLNPGMHFVMPFVYRTTEYSVLIQKEERVSECSTADLQEIKVQLAINYRLDRKRIPAIHKDTEDRFRRIIIVPAIEESIKASTAMFKVGDIIQKRAELRKQTIETLSEKLKKRNIILVDVSITNITFSPEYSNEVEKKQIAEQQIATERNKKLQAEETAKRELILARADAEKNRLQRKSIDKNVIMLEWIRKWDGKLPTYQGGGNSIISLPKLK